MIHFDFITPYQQTFCVVFTPAKQPAWWTFFIDKQFAHCFLLAPAGADRCVVIDPSRGGTGYYVYNCPIEVRAKEYQIAGNIVVMHTAHGKDMMRPRLKFFRTCVGICKDFLGIDKWWIVTPKQLYREVNDG